MNNVAHAGLARTTLGRYQLVKHLAQGGMADVLLARTTTGIEGFERHVVLKRIRAEAAHDERYVSMFLDEARLAASLHHHNIVQVTDIGQEGGEYFFTMEYVHGEDARALLAKASKLRQHVPLEHVLGIVCAAAAGLHHAHEQRGPDRAPLGLVHRDVSPANVLIGYDGGVKVADFGIAKAAHRTTETRSGTLKGKVAYMSPEQCVGDAVDRRSDVFALGILLYELLTVRRLFKGENDFLTMTAIVLGYIPPASQYRPDLPPELEDILMKALANKPEDRYQTAQDLRLALEALAAKLSLTILGTALADYMKQMFGTRPEPWLEEDDEPEIEIGIDFDGSASGVARVPVENLPQIETARLLGARRAPSIAEVEIAEAEISEAAPILRAKRRLEVVRDDEAPDHDDDDDLGPAIVAPTRPVVPVAAEAAVATPLAVSQPPRGRARTILGIVFAVASVCAFAAALWLSRSAPADPPAAAATHETPARAPRAIVPPEPAPAVTPAPTPTPSPTPSPTPEILPAEPVVQPSPPPVRSKPSRPGPLPSKKKPAPRPTKRWNPNSLFLE